MISVSEETYNTMCDTLINNTNNINTATLSAIISNYQLEIDSNRRLENIHNLKELIKILEKRDCLSKDNTNILHDIAQHLNLPAIFNSNQQHKKNEHPTTQPIESNQDIIKRKIRRKISDELGKSWVDFARALDVRECQIDELKMKGYSLKVCTEYILDYHEKEAHPRYWRTQLIEALGKARRNDLRLAVQRIIDDYS